MHALLDHKPPGEGVVYEGPDTIELYDANGNATGFLIGPARHVPVHEIEHDHFENTEAQIELIGPGGSEIIFLQGPAWIDVWFEQLEGRAHDDSGSDGLGGPNGFDEVMARGVRSVENLPAELVYAGFSLGVVPAQMLAQTRPGARGALFFYSCVPVSEFGQAWPQGVPVQVHGMDADPYFIDDGDVDAARALIAEAEDGELFLYPGDQHYFADSSLPSYDAEASALLLQRVLAFLAVL